MTASAYAIWSFSVPVSYMRASAARHSLREGAEFWRRQRQQQVRDGRGVPDGTDELAHHAEPAGDCAHAGVGGDVVRHDAREGGLARAIWADERHDIARAHLERDVAQQHPAVGKGEVEFGQLEMAHRGSLEVRGARLVVRVRQRECPSSVGTTNDAKGAAHAKTRHQLV